MTPRTKEQNEDIRLRRLAQIRKAAADVFLDKGPLLEIRDVAAQAGLGYGTVYHYYSNKGDLLNDLLWDALDRAGGWMGGAELSPDTASVRLLELWAEDHAVYLLYKQAGEGFASLPEARSSPLSAAFLQEVLTPFAALLADSDSTSGGNEAESPYRLQRAEMLLAALVGCASLSLRRGKLHEEARDITRLLKFQNE